MLRRPKAETKGSTFSMKLLKHRWGEKRPKTFFKSSHVVSINKAAPLAFCPNLFMCRAASYSCQPSSFGANYTLEMRAGICHGIRILTVYSDLQRALVARRIIASTHTTEPLLFEYMWRRPGRGEPFNGRLNMNRDELTHKTDREKPMEKVRRKNQ